MAAVPDPITDREYFGRLIDERDRQYNQRFQAGEVAVSAALAAQEKATSTALAAQERATRQAFDSSEKAIQKAEDSQTRHNAITNEFRGQLADQAKTFLPRLEADSRMAALADKIAAMQKIIDAGSNKSSGVSAGWGYAVAVVSLVIAAIAIASRFIP